MAAGEIGLVAVVDISRLSRNILDLCHFIDRAHRHDVLLAQGDQLIDFTDPNSNARLGFLPSGFNGQLGAGPVIADRVQAEDAPEEEAPEPPPVGYVRRADGSWAKDPDPRVRDTVTVIFDKIPETASIHGTLRYLRDAAEGETSTE
jgi:hypothetical protein